MGFIAGEAFAAGVLLATGVGFAGIADVAGDAFGDGDDAAITPFMTGVVAPATSCH